MSRGRSRRVVETIARADVKARRRTSAAPEKPRLLEVELSRALERAELMLQYQPIVDVRGGECRRFEALLRWRHPRLGILLPGDFMPLATSAGLLERIGEWVIEAAKRQWLEWKGKDDALGVSINVAGPEIEPGGGLEKVLRLIQFFDPDALTLEMNASLLTARPEIAVVAQRLAGAGARISLDDVGIADIPGRRLAPGLDEIKLSRHLLARATDPRALADLRALVELGRDYRLGVVAVGVEDKAAFDLAVSLGCDLAQGFWVSRPLIPDRLRPWRRWAVGVAFGGALALAAHIGASRAAASGGVGAAVTTSVRGLLPSMCCLDLPMAKATAAQSTVESLELRTGATFAIERTERADLYVEASAGTHARITLAAAIDRDMSRLEQQFGRSFTARPAIYAFATRAHFALGLQEVFGVRGPDAGILAAANGGVTLPRQGAIVINLQNVAKDGAAAIVRHELTHALVHEMIGVDATLPAWFDEGLATLEERTTDDAETATRRSAVALAVLSEGRGSLADLESQAEWATRNASLGGQGYLIAAEAVRVLERRISHDGLLRVLEATGRGDSFGSAYAAEAGESLTDFERAFPARLASEQETPRIAQSTWSEGVRWTAAGFGRSAPITVTIDGAGYHVEYQATTDRFGMYQAVFGGTAPKGEYTVAATARGLKATAVIRT